MNTPYEGGVFRMRLVIGQDWPTAPPKGKSQPREGRLLCADILCSTLFLMPAFLVFPAGFFTTRIFHPNVSSSGEICVNVLKKDWTADTELRWAAEGGFFPSTGSTQGPR